VSYQPVIENDDNDKIANALYERFGGSINESRNIFDTFIEPMTRLSESEEFKGVEIIAFLYGESRKDITAYKFVNGRVFSGEVKFEYKLTLEE